MITLVIACALQCLPPKPKPIHYTRQMRLEDSFKLLSKQPIRGQWVFRYE